MFMSTREGTQLQYLILILPLFQNESQLFLFSGKLLQVKVVGTFAYQVLTTGLHRFNCLDIVVYRALIQCTTFKQRVK